MQSRMPWRKPRRRRCPRFSSLKVSVDLVRDRNLVVEIDFDDTARDQHLAGYTVAIERAIHPVFDEPRTIGLAKLVRRPPRPEREPVAAHAVGLTAHGSVAGQQAITADDQAQIRRVSI